MRGDGGVYQRKGSTVWWCQYYLRGRKFRESTGQLDEKKALKFLRNRQKELGADLIGARQFIEPRMARKTVSDLLDALHTDYRLRGKDSYNFRCDLKIARAVFGRHRAVDLTAEVVDEYIAVCQEKGKAPSTINHKTQLLGQAYKQAIKRGELTRGPQIRKLTEGGEPGRDFSEKKSSIRLY